MFNFGKEPEQKSFDLIPVGDYEVFIEHAEERPTKSGRMKLNMRLRIRDDINQDCQGRCLFLDIFKKKPENLDEMDKQVEGYIYQHLYHLLDVTGILNSGKDFDSMSDICRLLMGREIRVTVYHETGKDGVKRAKIDQLKGVHESDPDYEDDARLGYYDTPDYDELPARQAQYGAPPAPAVPSGSIGEFEEIISDDDVPF